jgi:hypothetical protein
MLLSVLAHCFENTQLDSVRLVSYTFTTENLGRRAAIRRYLRAPFIDCF